MEEIDFNLDEEDDETLKPLDELFFDEGSSVSLSPSPNSEREMIYSINQQDAQIGKAETRFDIRIPSFVPAFHEANINMISSTSVNAKNKVSSWIKPAFFSEHAVRGMKSLGKDMIEEVGVALMNRMCPVELDDGVSGGFLMKKPLGGYSGIFKPEEALTRRSSSICMSTMDTPSHLCFRRGVKFCDSSVREVAAFLLDYESFANVPETVMVSVNWNSFSSKQQKEIQEFSSRNVETKSKRGGVRSRSLKSENSEEAAAPLISSKSLDGDDLWKQWRQWKVGSLQKFVDHDSDACDFSPAKFKTNQIQALGLFDVRVLNTDRHEGNILIKLKDEADLSSEIDITPIDHGLILPDFEEINVKGNFCWLTWPQSSQKFSTEIKEYIANLDAKEDCKMLIKMLGSKISLRGLLSLKIGTELLKISVLEFDLTLREIGEIIVGDMDFQFSPDVNSPLVSILSAAQQEANFYDPVENESAFFALFSNKLRDHIKSSRN